MNIIEQTKQILLKFPKISEVCNDIHIDFSEDEAGSYGLSSTGDSLVKQDILGNQTRKHTFVLYSAFQSFNDYDRLNNSGILLELSKWLEKQIEPPINRIIAENGMLYNIPNRNYQDILQYQLQIIVEYDERKD